MFTKEELLSITKSQEFIADYSVVQQGLVYNQAKQDVLFENEIVNRLAYFTEAILSSSNSLKEDGVDLFRIGAEISEVLSMMQSFNEITKKKLRFRAVLLYELANMPAIATTLMEEKDYPLLSELFCRRNQFRFLSESNENSILSDKRHFDFFELALSCDAFAYGEYAQGNANPPQAFASNVLSEISKEISLDFTPSELCSYEKIIRERFKLATRSNIAADLFDWIKKVNFPVELWQTQVKALKSGLLDRNYDSWGLASPTGTGKTFLTRLLIIDSLKKNSEAKVLYVVPSRALVYEVSSDLKAALEPLGFEVLALSAQMSQLLPEDENEFDEASVVVLTPEKADLLLRISQDTLNEVNLVIIDEAHHIEASTRGILLELYLWRLKRMLKHEVRFIFLSAVAPNIGDLTGWLGKNSASETVTNRATRMRAGVYKKIKNQAGKAEGWIEYSDGTKLKVVDEKMEVAQGKGLVQLCEKVRRNGPVLVVAKGKSTCENLAVEMQEWLRNKGVLKELSSEEKDSELFKRLDSRLEREMYPTVKMRELISNRIVYHHAGLPPRVRMAVERFIKKGFVDYVFATTTLAEGVNFPFSSVIVQSLITKETSYQKGVSPKYHPITPRSFWNIAGRAGRPGFDKEGQVILYEESLGISKVNLVMGDYLNPDPKGIKPVASALSESIKELSKRMQDDQISFTELDKIALSKEIPKKVKGTINLLRVGLVHAKAAKILDSPEEILEGSFAYRFLNDESKKFAKQLINQQSKILEVFFKSPGAPSEKMVAEIGLSIETIEELRNYVLNLEDWKIENLNKLFYGGQMNPDQVQYIVGPVSSRIAELEGEKLGGIYSDVVMNWLSGVPLSVVKGKSKHFTNTKLEDLIAIIYSRIQYLLPWGLYAMDSIIEEEAKKRGINYNNEVRNLSYLTDAGVPNFDALRLVNLDFERVDATRLTRKYNEKGGLNGLGVDIIGWIVHEDIRIIEQALKGFDNRRIDYDLPKLINVIRENN